MKSFKTHTFIVPAICVLAIVGYSMWYIAVEHKSAVVAGLQNRINEKKNTASRIASARTALSEITGNEEVIQNYFVKEEGVVAFIDDIETRGRLQKASVSVLSVKKESATSRLALAFTISINGTFDSVMRTIGAIEYAPYDITIESLSVGQDDKNVWHAEAKLLVGSTL